MKLITTSDGSHSVYSEKFDATYHSMHGAIQESQHVFIKSGLQYFLQSSPLQNQIFRFPSPLEKVPEGRMRLRGDRFIHRSFSEGGGEALKIFEMGFGTGLNAFLTFLEMQNSTTKVEYTVVDEFPLTKEIYTSLNYAELLKQQEHNSTFLKMHDCEWSGFCNISEKFALRKINSQLQNLKHDTEYHLIYFDAFAFTAQPELWTEEVFRSLFNALITKGVLVTYSAKGQVRRNLQSAGFQVERIQGPPGKREMLRAIKPLSLHA